MIRIGTLAATVGGAAWTIKSLAIVLMNGHFQPLEGVLYFIGVGGLMVGALGFSAFIANRWSGAGRWLLFVGAAGVALVVTALASSSIQSAVADAYTGTNVGLEEEMGILTPGAIWLAIGIFLVIATRKPAEGE